MTTIDFFGRTDIGSKRERNEDSFLCLDLVPLAPGLSGPAVLLTVADGIGGQAGGGVASALATESLKEHFSRELGALASPPDWTSLLAGSFQAANLRIFERIGEDTNLAGMGTTLVAAVVSGGAAHVANIGDSRAYRVRGREIVQITRDHSWVAEQARLRPISEWELSRSPFRHMITRSLGFEPDVQADAFEVDLAGGDYVLLCSDGLYSALPDRELAQAFDRSADPESICLRLLESADRAGSRDNITAVVARWGEAGRKGGRLSSGGRRSRPGG
jgi:serine/threonine protein phosphatase PrpC